MTNQSGAMKQGYLAISVCIFGISFSPLFYKLAYATGMNALWVNVFRLLFTVAVMAGITFLSPKNRRAILKTSKKAFWVSALAGTMLALHLNAWALALVYTDSFAASTILGTYTLLTVLLSAWLLKEKTSRGALVGLIIATAGVVVCNFGGGLGRMSGNMYALFAAVTEALYVLCGRKAREELGAIPYTTILYSFTLLWMVVMALFVGVPASVPSEGLFWAGLLALISTLLGHSMASVALKYFKAATVSAIMMSGIITGPMIVLLFLNDPPTLFTGIGGTVILFGLSWYLIVERREAKQLVAKTAAEAAAEAGNPL